MFNEIFLARRYLFRGKAKHVSFIGLVSCLGLILGVAAIIIALSIVNGIDGGLMERIMRFKDHIIIEAQDQETLSQLKESVSDWPEVDSASLSVETQIFAKFKEGIVPLIVKGIDFKDPKARDFFANYVIVEQAKEGFFVGESLRRRFSFEEELEFYPLQKKLALVKDKVRGFFSVGLYDIDNQVLVTDLKTARDLSENYHFYLGLKISEPLKASKLKEKIIHHFGREIFVSSWIETNEALFATLKLEKIAMFIILSLIVLIASFNIFASLTVKVVEKTKDIGILRSLGFSSRKILSIFTLQGLILGLIGVSIGVTLGLGACYFLKAYPFIRLPEEIFFTEYLPIVVDYQDIVWIVILALFIAFVSSLLPAHRAAKMNIAEALRYE